MASTQIRATDRIVRTIIGGQVQTNLTLGLPHAWEEHSTLNEKLQIQSKIYPEGNPAVRYFCIGNQGHEFIRNANGIPSSMPIAHEASDLSPWKIKPFVMREVGNDLTTDERAKFGLRRIETLEGGKKYICYYGRRIDFDNVVRSMRYTKYVDGVAQTIEWHPTDANLNPARPDIPTTGILVATGEYYDYSCKVSLVWTPWDINEYLNVAKLTEGGEEYAVISEIGMVSAGDKIVRADDGQGSAFDMNEIVGAQVTDLISTYHNLYTTNDTLTLKYDLGALEARKAGPTGAEILP